VKVAAVVLAVAVVIVEIAAATAVVARSAAGVIAVTEVNAAGAVTIRANSLVLATQRATWIAVPKPRRSLFL
jgi:hypothetical protein